MMSPQLRRQVVRDSMMRPDPVKWLLEALIQLLVVLNFVVWILIMLWWLL